VAPVTTHWASTAVRRSRASPAAFNNAPKPAQNAACLPQHQ
jgi:hypothetical protein